MTTSRTTDPTDLPGPTASPDGGVDRVPGSSRIVPPGIAGERAMLEHWLDFHRATLADKCAGLDDAQLRTASAEPSGMTLLGLIRHMADCELHWFGRILTGEPTTSHYCTREDPDRDWHITGRDSSQEALATWRSEIERARRAAAGRSLEHVGHDRARDRAYNLRWIYVHMIEEYARHNGHADLLRERIDGATGF